MILILFMYLLYGLAFNVGKLALTYVPPLHLIGIRMLVAGLLLVVYEQLYARKSIFIKLVHIIPFLFLILFHIIFSYVPEFIALQYMSPAKACLLYNLAPFITALILFCWKSVKITSKQLLGLIIGFLGYVPVLSTHVISEGSGGLFAGRLSWPEILMLFSVFSSCIGWLLVQHMVTVYRYRPVVVNGLSMLCGGLVVLCCALIAEPTFAFSQLAGTPSMIDAIMSIGLLILIANIICYNLYAYLLHQYSATLLSFMGFSAPLFAALFDWMMWGQVITSSFLFTLGAVVVGLYLFYSDEFK